MLFAIIDDEREVCDVLRLFFESRGHRCAVAYDGREGLAMVRARRPDAVFLDIQMAGMNGYEVLCELKKDPATAAIPVMLMTAVVKNTSLSAEEWAKNTGADAFLAKPFELEQLMGAVESMTGVQI